MRRRPESWSRRYVPFGACLLLCLWLFLDSSFQAAVGPSRLLPLFAALALAALSLTLLGIRSTRPLACILSVYLMALGIMARDNMAGLRELPVFAFDIYRPLTTTFRPAHLVWILLLGAAPLLFAYLYTQDDTAGHWHPLRLLNVLGLTLGFALLQALCIFLASHGGFGMFSMTALAQRLPIPQHQLLLYAAPVLMAQQGLALWLLWHYSRRWKEERHQAILLAFAVATLFIAAVIIANVLLLPAAGIVANLCAYLVPTAFVWAIERYALFDIRVTIRRVVQYTLARQILTVMTFGPLMLAAFLIGFLLNPTQQELHGWPGAYRELARQGTLICSILFCIFALILMVRAPLLRWFDRTYFREVYDAQETLNRIGRSLVGLSDSREIARRALAGIEGVLHPLNARLLAREETGVISLAHRGLTGHHPAASPDASLLHIEEVHEILPNDSESLARIAWVRDLTAPARMLLETETIRLIVPLREEDQTTGALLLGEKASGVAYTPEDIEVLIALTSQITLALQSARLNREFLRRGTQELTERSADFIAEVERERRLLAADLHDQTLPELRALLTDLELMAEAERENHEEGKREEGKEKSNSTNDQPQTPNGEHPTILIPEHLNTKIENPLSETLHPPPTEMADNLRTTIANIRDMMESLRPSALEMLGLLPALESELRKATARARPPLIPVFRASAEAEKQKLSAFEEVSVFRIMQEAVNNACRHASAQSVRVEVDSVEGGWQLVVEDDGTGLPRQEARRDGHGLNNIRYRAGLIGATVHWSVPENGRGTRMELRFPLRRRSLPASRT